MRDGDHCCPVVVPRLRVPLKNKKTGEPFRGFPRLTGQQACGGLAKRRCGGWSMDCLRDSSSCGVSMIQKSAFPGEMAFVAKMCREVDLAGRFLADRLLAKRCPGDVPD